MTIATSTVEISGLTDYLDPLEAVVTGPVAGVWTITAPDTVNQATLDAAVASEIAYRLALQNTAALMVKAAAAQVSNATFLALASPTNAQTLAQVKALTRQSNALIKLASADLSNTTGT